MDKVIGDGALQIVRLKALHRLRRHLAHPPRQAAGERMSTLTENCTGWGWWSGSNIALTRLWGVAHIIAVGKSI